MIDWRMYPVNAIRPMYTFRVFGGVLYLAGSLVMAWNIYQTIRGRKRDEAPMVTRVDAAAA